MFVDVDYDLPSESHHVFVDGVVEDFFEQYVDSVVGICSVAEFPYVHAGTPADMFFPVECTNVVLAVVCFSGDSV